MTVTPDWIDEMTERLREADGAILITVVKKGEQTGTNYSSQGLSLEQILFWLEINKLSLLQSSSSPHGRPQ